MPNPRIVDERLAELYERVPKMLDCRGKCADSCGPIEMSVRERVKIERESGRKVEAICGSCSMLTPMGRCSQYELRPMLCRLFGTAKSMECVHGCRPERWLSEEECGELLVQSLLIGGAPARWSEEGLRGLTSQVLSELGAYAAAIRLREAPTLRGLLRQVP